MSVDASCPASCPGCRDVTLHAESLEALFHSLRELVDGLHVRRNVFAVIEDVRPSYRYAQVLADRDGALLVEVSSTEATRDRDGSAALTPAEELELMRLRFAPPDEWSPNWYRVFAEPWPWPAPVVAELLVHALVWVLGVRPGDLRVKTAHAEVITVVDAPSPPPVLASLGTRMGSVVTQEGEGERGACPTPRSDWW